MTTNKETIGLFSRQYKMLSGSWLKVLAMLSMSVDHVAYILLRGNAVYMAPLFAVGGKGVSCYFLMRCAGRLAFPLFAFLIVEGFVHTRSRWKYGRNLLLSALVSEVPWSLLHNGFHWAGHNVMFTLLAGFAALCAIERCRGERVRLAVILLGLLVGAQLLRTDYGGTGVAFIVMLYALRRHCLLRAVVGSFMLPSRWMAGLAFIPMSLYNGRRGFIGSSWGKYLFYAFYPLHLLLLYFIRQGVEHL